MPADPPMAYVLRSVASLGTSRPPPTSLMTPKRCTPDIHQGGADEDCGRYLLIGFHVEGLPPDTSGGSRDVCLQVQPVASA